MTTIGEFATAAGRRPDWWLQSAADAMREAHRTARAGGDPWSWLADRIDHLIYLAEHSTSGSDAA